MNRKSLAGTVAAALLVTALAAAPVRAQNVLEISPSSTTPGGTASVTVRLTHTANVQGFQTAMTWDNTVLTLSTVDTNGTDVAALLLPNTIEFFTTTGNPAISPGVGWGASAAIFDFSPPFTSQILPPGSQQSIVVYRFATVANPALVGTTTTLQLTNGLGSPPLFNVITVAGSSVLPTRVDGTIEFVNQPLFKRGDANGEGVVNIADAIFMIQYIFNDGPSPQCMEAANANGDSFTDISDAIFLIQFQFLDGNQPPAPYPACGVDTVGPSGSCNTYNPC